MRPHESLGLIGIPVVFKGSCVISVEFVGKLIATVDAGLGFGAPGGGKLVLKSVGPTVRICKEKLHCSRGIWALNLVVKLLTTSIKIEVPEAEGLVYWDVVKAAHQLLLKVTTLGAALPIKEIPRAAILRVNLNFFEALLSKRGSRQAQSRDDITELVIFNFIVTCLCGINGLFGAVAKVAISCFDIWEKVLGARKRRNWLGQGVPELHWPRRFINRTPVLNFLPRPILIALKLEILAVSRGAERIGQGQELGWGERRRGQEVESCEYWLDYLGTLHHF